MDKSPDAFRTISEVADWLGVPTHVLRFWESRFTQVKPVKRAGGRRYYRPADMQLLGGIKRLLHDEGLTIRGVQKMLREEGVRHVSSFSQPLDVLEPLRDVTDHDGEGATPMAVDVEPEVADNVIPLMPAVAEAPQTAASPPEDAEMSPLVLRDHVDHEAPPAEAFEAGAEGTEDGSADGDLAEHHVPEAEAAVEMVAEEARAEEAVAEGYPTEDGLPEDRPAEEERAEDDRAQVPAAEVEPVVASQPASAEDEEPIPVFSFLRRRSSDGTPLSIQPDLFATPAPAPEPLPEPEAGAQPETGAPEPEPVAAAARPVIPDTPGVPDTDAADDDPLTPARPGMAARLATGRLRVDPAAIARVVADLRDLRARL